MASSGLIVAFVVALWAAYFVPLVLRRYDEANKNSALDTEGPMRRVVTPPRPDQAEPAPPRAERAPRPKPKPTITRETARIAARRRRRTLLTLVAVLAIVGGVAGFGYLPLWSIAVPAGLIVAWLIACRLMVRQELGLATPRERAPKPTRAPKERSAATAPRRGAGRWSSVKKAASSWASSSTDSGSSRQLEDEDTIIVQVDDIDPDRKHVMEDVPLTSDALDEQLQIAVPSVGTSGEMLWDPLPVTLPTYVTKPRAGRTVRTIDFTQAGAWTSGHVEGEDVDFPAPNADENPDTNRRAVGH
ncbi:hypothetical protein EHW97_00895 [Aeromicrobium camelliae]|uniref:Uncharacterized protein n=1 Tax=Aeromicrobium camelliae TaxID=1538144 RepID=A0A3N6X7S3_9ACTN|nr:hypothetical protein [Aeromicrobium camelliae]RQN10085.1 hypothetical protein EHW97_00895 [Aeromicrobium camelliae]